MSKTKEIALPGRWRRAVTEAGRDELDPNAKFILHTMSTYLTSEGQVSISIARLVKYTGKAKRSVLRGVADAISAGYLERTLRGHFVSSEIRQQSRYQVRIPESQGAKNDMFACGLAAGEKGKEGREGAKNVSQGAKT